MELLDVKDAIVINREALEEKIKLVIVDTEDCIIHKSESVAFYCMGILRTWIIISGNDFMQDKEYLRLARMIHQAFDIDMHPTEDEKS